MHIFNIPTYTDWRRNTHVPYSIRSDKLRALDAAIQKYQVHRFTFAEREIMSEDEHRSQSVVVEIRWALEKWQKSQGPGEAWKSSPRNRMHEFTSLHEAVRLTSTILNAKPDSYEENLANSRLGILYLLSNLTVVTKTLNLVAIPTITLAGGVLTEMHQTTHHSQAALERINDAQDYVRYGGNPTALIAKGFENAVSPRTPNPSTTLYDILVNWLKTFADRLVITLKTLFIKKTCRYGPNEINWTLILSSIKKLILVAVKTLLDVSLSLIANTSDIINKLTMVTNAALTCIKNWLRGRAVSILYGHPSTICKSLKSSMQGDLKGGLLSALKSSITLAVLILIPVGGIAARGAINIFSTILETMYLFISRQLKISEMRHVFATAREFYRVALMDKNLAKTFVLVPPQERAPLIQNNTNDFFNWFHDAVASIPEIAALVLNSGICGDPMHFLDMVAIAGHGQQINAQDKREFQKGVEYITDLKNYSANMLRTSPYIFTSELPDINGYITAAKQFNTNDSNRVWDNFKSITSA